MTEAEKALVCAAVFSNQAISQTGVLPEQFSCDNGRKIWQTMLSIHASGDPVDAITLQAKLKGDATAMRLLGESLSGQASAANAEAYAKAVIEDATRRDIEAIGQRIEAEAAESDPQALAGTAISELVGITAGDKNAEADAKSLMAETLEAIDLAASGRQMGLPSGFSKLDRILGGWHPGELVIVGARPAMGKSAFGLSVAMNAARKGARVGFVSTEMDKKSLGLRMAAASAGIPIQKARNGALSQPEWDRLIKASNQIAKLPIRMLEAPGWTIGQIVRQAHAWSAVGNDLLIIDYLQRIAFDGKHDRHDLAIGDTALQAKTLAATLGIPVIMLAQLSRGVESREDKRPRMSDLRDSGQIEQEADAVLMLYREHVYDDEADPRSAEILVEKNRQGPTGFVSMSWEPDTAQWLDPDVAAWSQVA